MLSGILWAVVAVLVILWLVGFVIVHVSGGLIHLLLLAAVIVLIYNLVVGSRTRRTM
ncbi:MAG TPA: lmo0937 family membrane protein [Ktedonobacteraceae bacterium]